MLTCDKSTSHQAIANPKDSKRQPTRYNSKNKETKSVTNITQTANNSNPYLSETPNPEIPSLHCNNCLSTKSHVTSECRNVGKMSNAATIIYEIGRSLFFVISRKIIHSLNTRQFSNVANALETTQHASIANQVIISHSKINMILLSQSLKTCRPLV